METFITLWHFCGAQQRVCNYCKVLKAQHAVWEEKKKQRGTFHGNKSADLHKTQNNSAGTPKNFSTFCYSSVVFVSKSLNLPLPFCSPDYPKIDRVKKKKRQRDVKTHLTDCNSVSSTAESRIRKNGTNADCTKTSVRIFKSHWNLKLK